jgi:hypothetical protein
MKALIMNTLLKYSPQTTRNIHTDLQKPGYEDRR